jgi:orotidine-5'-phosphate decarboxylase
VVCAPRDVPEVKGAGGKGFLAVVPGIRPAGAELGDQKRAATPAEALSNGADLLVVGRPVTAASDPDAALDLLLGQIQSAS